MRRVTTRELTFVMTDELHDVMRTVEADHRSVSELVKKSESRLGLRSTSTDLEGVGPTTADVLLREIPDGLIGARP
jgi:hypothetical protein